MLEIELLKQILNEQFGSRYVIEPNLMLIGSENDAYTYAKTTEEAIVNLINDRRVKGILRTSQSEYIALNEVETVSFMWSLELACDVEDKVINADIERVIKNLNGVVNQFNLSSNPLVAEMYYLQLTFNMPCKFNSVTISGTKYVQVVVGGKCTFTDKSMLASETVISVDGITVKGVITNTSALSCNGESYTEDGNTTQKTAMQSCGNTLTMQIHSLRDNEFCKNLFVWSITGYTDITRIFAINIKNGEIEVNINAKIAQITQAGNAGGFIVYDVQFVRC